MSKCECGFKCAQSYNMDRHRASMQHAKNMMKLESALKRDKSGDESGYTCTACEYSTTRKFNYSKHLLSERHKFMIDRASTKVDNPLVDKIVEVFEMAMKSQLQNNDMIKVLTERLAVTPVTVSTPLAVQQTNVQATSYTGNTNCHNKKFNLNIYLNEKCGNAMNLSDFVKNMVITLEDLEHLGEVGYATGMSNIISRALREKEEKERPVHCSDIKRETIYIRENDAWTKDIERQETLKAIEHISNKNYKAFAEWRLKHPDHVIQDSHEYEAWARISKSMCGSCNEANLNKVMHNLAIATAIDKDNV